MSVLRLSGVWYHEETRRRGSGGGPIFMDYKFSRDANLEGHCNRPVSPRAVQNSSHLRPVTISRSRRGPERPGRVQQGP